MNNKSSKHYKLIAVIVNVALITVILTACQLTAATVATESGYPPPGLTPSPTSPGYPPPATIEPTPTELADFPVVDTPDPKMAALAMTMPACCDTNNPVATLSPSEIVFSTQVVLTSRPPATAVATVQDSSISYLAPSEKWISFIHAKELYGFDYPQNWFVSYQASGQIVTISNFSLNRIEKSIDSPNRFRLDVYLRGYFKGYDSLKSFADAQKQPGDPSKVLAETLEQLDNGYQILWRDTTTPLNKLILEVWLTDGQTVYQMITTSVDPQFQNILDRIVKSFIIRSTP